MVFGLSVGTSGASPVHLKETPNIQKCIYMESLLDIGEAKR